MLFIFGLAYLFPFTGLGKILVIIFQKASQLSLPFSLSSPGTPMLQILFIWCCVTDPLNYHYFLNSSAFCCLCGCFLFHLLNHWFNSLFHISCYRFFSSIFFISDFLNGFHVLFFFWLLFLWWNSHQVHLFSLKVNLGFLSHCFDICVWYVACLYFI